MYDFKGVEEEVLQFWEKNDIYPTLKKRNSTGKKYYFLQGPPYTSGYLHLGHAWNNSMKDMAMRYHRMKKEDVWDRGGYDMHGLPTAHKVMAELNFTTKDDIEKYGVDKFVQKCMDYSIDKAQTMSKDLWRMGVWMDHENAYMPVKNTYIQSVWYLIKRAEEEGRLYEGLRTLTWCSNCATAMAKHECEYKHVTDKSVFVKFKVAGKENEYLIIWTTTPWTLPFNVGIMVHPELEYVKVKVDNEIWTIAKGLVTAFIKEVADKDYEIVEECIGEKLKGLRYEHFWENDIIPFKELKQKYPNIHTVLLSNEYVSLKGGSGLVHMAAGCGPEDYEVGHVNNIPPFNNLDEKGVFPETMGRFSNFVAKKDDKKFIQLLEDDGVLIASTSIEHDYAHCERCHNPVIFRATKQWFFKIEDLKEDMLEENKVVHWVPEAGKNAFNGWLSHLRDNSITKQRYWGTPAPIWRCEEGDDYIVIESVEELESYGVKAPDNLHKPWIDEIVIEKDGKKYRRIPDILDVWIDAGCASWACLDYPQNKEILSKYFPADFILEAKEQVRGWFNLLMVASMIAFGRNCFNSVYMHGMLTDVQGVKMSKSLGNVISPYELIEKYGSDTMRMYMTRTPPGEDVNFSWEEVKLKYKNLSVLWNVHNYLIDYAKNVDVKPSMPESKYLGLEERYILSKLHSTIRKVTELMEIYQMDKVPKEIEELFLELSRTYIQWTRDKINEDPLIVLGVISEVLMGTVKLLSIVAPFISEKMYLNLKDVFSLEEESIHYFEWPKYDEKWINVDLEENVKIVQELVQASLAARDKVRVGVRWPLAKLTIASSDGKVRKAVESLKPLLLSHVNIKDLEIVSTLEGSKITVTPNRNAIGKDFKKESVIILEALDEEKLQELAEKGSLHIEGFNLNVSHVNIKEELPEGFAGSLFSKGVVYVNTNITPELEREGFSREITRRVQQLRKDEEMEKKDRIILMISSEYDLSTFAREIKSKVGAKTLEFSDDVLSISSSFEVKGQKFTISFDKI
jgi:isoleucyl-tRNA synthetase